MKLRLMLWTVVVASLTGVEVQADQQANQSSQGAERLSVATQEPLRLTIPTWIGPTPKRFGVFTIAPPERRGEFVRMSVPIGELTMRAAHAIGQARYRRAERKARKEVEHAIKELQAERR